MKGRRRTRGSGEQVLVLGIRTWRRPRSPSSPCPHSQPVPVHRQSPCSSTKNVACIVLRLAANNSLRQWRRSLAPGTRTHPARLYSTLFAYARPRSAPLDSIWIALSWPDWCATLQSVRVAGRTMLVWWKVYRIFSWGIIFKHVVWSRDFDSRLPCQNLHNRLFNLKGKWLQD